MLLIAGSAPFTSFGELEGSRDTYVHFIQQPFDQGSLVRPYVKWEYTLPSGVTSKEILRRAHTIMHSEPAGPVYLMLPREILTEPWDEQSSPLVSKRSLRSVAAGRGGSRCDRAARRAATQLQRIPPLSPAMPGRDEAASAIIQKLSAFAGIRVIDFLTFVNIGRSFHAFWRLPSDKLADVDVGLLVDVDVPWIPMATRDNPATFWAQIDVDVLKSASPMWSFLRACASRARAAASSSNCSQPCRKSAMPEFVAAAADARGTPDRRTDQTPAAGAELAADKGQHGQINPHYVCAEIGKAIGPEDIVVNEAVTRQSIPNMQIARPKPGTMISNAGGELGASGGTAPRHEAGAARPLRRADRRRWQLLLQQPDGCVRPVQTVQPADPDPSFWTTPAGPP